MAVLEPLEILNGIFSLIFVIITNVVGMIIASKYFKLKQREFLLVGISWMGICSPWWPSSISFLLVLISGRGLSTQMYFLIGNSLIPIFILIWLTAFNKLRYNGKQKKIIIIYALYGIIFEIIFFNLLFNDYNSIGELKGYTDVEYKYFVMGYLLSIVLTIFVTGIIFVKASLKSEDPEIKLKGKLLLIGLLSWVIGALMDAAIPLNLITLPIIRILLISSSIMFLGGWILPTWMKNLFLKEVVSMDNLPVEY